MVHEIACDILRQAEELHVAQQVQAASSSKAELRLWTWRCKYHPHTNTEFQMCWGLRRTDKGALVVNMDGFQFNNYSPQIARYLAKTFLQGREEDLLTLDQREAAEVCEPYNSEAPDHFDYQGDLNPKHMLDRLKLGKVEVEVYNSFWPSPGPALRFCSDVDTSSLAQCIDEALQLYMLGQFIQ